MNNPYFLAWDSNFFNRKIGKIEILPDEVHCLKNKLEEAREKNYNLIYGFSHGTQLLDDDILNEFSGKLVDFKITYSQSLATFDTFPLDNHIGIFRNECDLLTLYELAYESGKYSRYSIDNHFTKDEFKRLYSKWIDNSILGYAADVIFVYKQNDSIVGFITVKKEESSASIGLIATDTNKREKGIGKALMNHIRSYLKKHSVETLNVVTQRENRIACKFYEANGFLVKDQVTVYHFWL